jgi:hypothetical protein
MVATRRVSPNAGFVAGLCDEEDGIRWEDVLAQIL